jgi:hypothetical protein
LDHKEADAAHGSLVDGGRRSRYRRSPGRSLAWRAGHSQPRSQARRELASCAGAIAAGRRRNVILLDGDKELVQDQADANGEWIIIAQDPPLSAGKHELRVIQHVDGRAPVTSDQVVVAIVPDQKQSGPEEKTLIWISPSAGAAKLMQPPSAAGVPKSGDLVMSTLDYDEGGHITVTGLAWRRSAGLHQ